MIDFISFRKFYDHNQLGHHTRLSTFYELSPCGMVAKVPYCGLEASEFELRSRYYVHFRTNILRKGMNHLILLVKG